MAGAGAMGISLVLHLVPIGAYSLPSFSKLTLYTGVEVWGHLWLVVIRPVGGAVGPGTTMLGHTSLPAIQGPGEAVVAGYLGACNVLTNSFVSGLIGPDVGQIMAMVVAVISAAVVTVVPQGVTMSTMALGTVTSPAVSQKRRLTASVHRALATGVASPIGEMGVGGGSCCSYT